MVNLYDSPAQAQFVNTYVPIQFESLYKLTDKATENMREGNALMDKMNEYKNLNSMSDVDNALWAKEFGRVTDFVDNDIKDIYSLQDPIVRNKLFSTVRKLASNPLLGMMRENKEIYKNVMSKSDPRWGQYYRNKIKYNNTATNGLWTENPMEWSEWAAENDTYTKDLGESLIRKDGMYDVYGIKQSDYNAIMAKNSTAILNNPALAKRAEADYYNGLVTPESNPEYFMDEKGNTTEFNASRYAFDMVYNSGLDKLTGEKRVFSQERQFWAAEAGRNRRFNAHEANRKKENEVPSYTELAKRDANEQMSMNKRGDVSSAISNKLMSLPANATPEQRRLAGESVMGKEAYAWYVNSNNMSEYANQINTKKNQMAVIAANGGNTKEIEREIKDLTDKYTNAEIMVNAYLPEVDRQISIDENDVNNNRRGRVFTKERVLLNNKAKVPNFVNEEWAITAIGPKTKIKTSDGMTINGYSPRDLSNGVIADANTGRSNFSGFVFRTPVKGSNFQDILTKVTNGVSSNSLTNQVNVVPTGDIMNENGNYTTIVYVQVPEEAAKQRWGISDGDINILKKNISGVSRFSVDVSGSDGLSVTVKNPKGSSTSSSSDKNTVQYISIPVKVPYLKEQGNSENQEIDSNIYKDNRSFYKDQGSDSYNSFGVSYSESETGIE